MIDGNEKNNDLDEKMLENSIFSHLNFSEKFDNKQELSEIEIKVSQVEKRFEESDSSKLQGNRPVLDSSLPYIPVYTHLITYDLAPIERPTTPPIIKMIKSELRTESPSRSTPESKKTSRYGRYS